jgi:hypothetical protein
MQNTDRPTSARIHWYPGCALLQDKSAGFLEYLQHHVPGLWIFSDNAHFPESSRTPKAKFFSHLDTFSPDLPNVITNNPLGTLVISCHPGLKTLQLVKESGLLERHRPQTLFYREKYNEELFVLRPDASALESLGYFYLKTEIFPQFKRHHHVIKRVNL